MVKVEVITIAELQKPKVGEGYGDYGICGRPMYYSTTINKVTKTHIHLKDDGKGIMKDKRTKIPLAEYFYHKITKRSGTKSKTIISVDGNKTEVV